MIDEQKKEGILSCIRGFIDSDPKDKINQDFKEEQLRKLYIEYKELTGRDYSNERNNT